MRRRRSRKARAVRALIALLATGGGAVVGFMVTLAIVVAKARFGHYIFALSDLAAVRWETVPVLLGAIGGLLLGVWHPRALDRATVWGSGAMLAGIVIGAFAGGLLWGEGEGQWAGGIIAGAMGLVAGGTASFRPHRREHRPLLAGAFGAIALSAVAAIGVFGVTNTLDLDPLEFVEFGDIPPPDAANVDAVVFLVGDAGATVESASPLLNALRADVEHWSAALARDSAVSIVFLGDIVYPVGVRARDHPEFATDSARLWNQIELVGGPEATEHATLGVFLTGNHDWGNASGEAGIDRILNLAEQIGNARRQGRHVVLVPNAGEPGPVIRDLRQNVRLIFLDTHWFLQARPGTERQAFFERLEHAIESAGQREVIMAAHHPWHSAGPHGAIIPGYHTGGIAYLLKKSGALVQDLNSPVYTDLLIRMRSIFATTDKRPLAFAGGHDHSLQVLAGTGDHDPRFALVSGAGSKLSSIRMMPGLVWGASKPGYMMLVFRKDDGVDLFVKATHERYLLCSGAPAELAGCMAEGVRAFQTVYTSVLLGPAKQPVPVAPAVPDTVRAPAR
jgi:hypothetical protein